MTDEQYEKAKRAYEKRNPGKKFERLRLFEMNLFLSSLCENEAMTNKEKENNE